MVHSFEGIREASPALRQALLKSQEKRMVGVIAFIALFAALANRADIRAWLGHEPLGIVAAALVISFEFWIVESSESGLAHG